jgi:hypothetical protein
MATTEAPMIPVVAANTVETTMTAIPRPPRRPPSTTYRASNNPSETLERSRIWAMKMNKGTATRV